MPKIVIGVGLAVVIVILVIVGLKYFQNTSSKSESLPSYSPIPATSPVIPIHTNENKACESNNDCSKGLQCLSVNNQPKSCWATSSAVPAK